MKHSFYILAFVLICSCCKETTEQEKPRIIVTCDPELDDKNSLIRYLLFSTDYKTEGIIYASSQFHWKGDGKGTTQFIPGFGSPSYPDNFMPGGFLTECQNAFAARMKWSVTSEYAYANHYPVVRGPLSVHATRGEEVTIKAKVSDPDGDELSKNWITLQVGTYKGVIKFDYANDNRLEFTVPDNALPGDTIHILLQVTDSGVPRLTRYLRTVVTVI